MISNFEVYYFYSLDLFTNTPKPANAHWIVLLFFHILGLYCWKTNVQYCAAYCAG